jgi:hypothetical protein
VLNLEMLGRPQPDTVLQAWFTGREYSDLESICAPVLEAGGVRCVEFGMQGALFGASDNYPFAKAGVVAHSLSAGHLHTDYHRPGDSADKIEFAHMTAVVNALRAVVLELADRDARPSFTVKGRAALQSGR